MPYLSKESRKEYYDKHKEEINRKRREYNRRPEVLKRKKEQEKKYRKENKEKLKKIHRKGSKKYRKKMKKLVLEHYGKECICCGEKNSSFLTVDHIHGGGTKHRKKIWNHINIWLVKNNFPKGFQILCFNCNWGKYYNEGICPHK